jgi:hypothetical protein
MDDFTLDDLLSLEDFDVLVDKASVALRLSLLAAEEDVSSLPLLEVAVVVVDDDDDEAPAALVVAAFPDDFCFFFFKNQSLKKGLKIALYDNFFFF